MSMVLALCNRVAATAGRTTTEGRILDSLKLFEADSTLGGKMGRYRINANTSAHDVVRGIADDTPFVDVRDRYLKHPETQSKLMALPRMETLMVQPLANSMRKFLGARLQCGTRVERIEVSKTGYSTFDTEDRLLARSQNLLLCCGAREAPLDELEAFTNCWEGSGKFLLRESVDDLPSAAGPVVIVGASHSAFSCAWRLLHDPLFAEYVVDREIFILQRRERIKLRCTQAFAARHRVEYDAVQDVCPYSGMVYRNGGLRKDAKKLYLKIRDGRESRVKLVTMNNLDEHRDLLKSAGLILQATGFLPAIPQIVRDGNELSMGKPSQYGELRDLASDQILPGLFGMGLGLNILPDGNPRGEASFSGGIHGFQSYPLSIAPGLIERLVLRTNEETLH